MSPFRARFVLALLLPSLLGAQTPPELIALGRRLIAARHLDSALTVLRQVSDADGVATAAERGEAWVLVGVVRFYTETDSAASAAFRQAFRLDPGLQVAGLERLDPDISLLLVNARPTAGVADAPLYHCVPRCEKGLRRPVLRHLPPLHLQEIGGGFGLGRQGVRGVVTVRGIVGEDGRFEPGSVQAVGAISGVRPGTVEEGLRQAEFRPGEVDGRPVRVLVELRYTCREEGTNRMSCEIRGP